MSSHSKKYIASHGAQHTHLAHSKAYLYTSGGGKRKKVSAREGIKNQYDPIFDRVASEHGIPKEILNALAYSESRYQPDTVGKSGEKGLMQLMPGIVREYGVQHPFDPYENVSAAAKYLKHLYQRAGSDWKTAIGYYNQGESGFKKHGQETIAKRQAYYDHIYGVIDNLTGNKPQQQNDFQGFKPLVADATKTNYQVPGKETLFPVQKSTLPSLSKPLPKTSQSAVRSAAQGIEQPSFQSLTELYDKPSLAENPDFVQNLFKLRSGGQNTDETEGITTQFPEFLNIKTR